MVYVMTLKFTADYNTLFTNLICFSSKFWDLPDHCALPWQELFDDEIETKTTEKNLAGNLKEIQILRIFSLLASLFTVHYYTLYSQINLFQFKVLALARSFRITLARTVLTMKLKQRLLGKIWREIKIDSNLLNSLRNDIKIYR